MRKTQWGWMTTLVGSNENIKLELPRAWEPLESSEPSQTCEGSSSRGMLSDGDQIKQRGTREILWRFAFFEQDCSQESKLRWQISFDVEGGGANGPDKLHRQSHYGEGLRG